MHRFKKQVFRRQAEALAASGPQPTPRAMPGQQPAVAVNPAATGRPFATAAMASMKRRARRRPDLASVTNAWRGNEGALLEQIAAGDDIARLIESMEQSA
jgi:hypothetical protein